MEKTGSLPPDSDTRPAIDLHSAVTRYIVRTGALFYFLGLRDLTNLTFFFFFLPSDDMTPELCDGLQFFQFRCHDINLFNSL